MKTQKWLPARWIGGKFAGMAGSAVALLGASAVLVSSGPRHGTLTNASSALATSTRLAGAVPEPGLWVPLSGLSGAILIRRRARIEQIMKRLELHDWEVKSASWAKKPVDAHKEEETL